MTSRLEVRTNLTENVDLFRLKFRLSGHDLGTTYVVCVGRGGAHGHCEASPAGGVSTLRSRRGCELGCHMGCQITPQAWL